MVLDSGITRNHKGSGGIRNQHDCSSKLVVGTCSSYDAVNYSRFAAYKANISSLAPPSF